jgi:hypothetical protein
MNIDSNINMLISGLNIAPLKEAFINTSQQEWDDFTLRQDTFDVASDTKTIVMKFNGPTQQCNHPSKTTTFEPWLKWKPLVEPLISQVQKIYPNTVISKCFFPRLKAGGKIDKHVDSGITLEMVHRIHVPIQTNEDAIFTVGGESINMIEGCAYEINNQRKHGVVNNGNTDRVHLVFDLYKAN